MPTPRQISATYRFGTSSAPVTPGTPPPPDGLQVAADSPEVKNFSVKINTYTGMNTKVPHVFANGTGRILVLTYDNWGVGPNFDEANTNAVTFEGSLSEMDGSTFYRAYFYRIVHADGTVENLTPWTRSSVTIEGGAYAVAAVDLGSTSRVAGTQLMEHAYVSCASGGYLWRHQANLTGTRGETVTASVGETSQVMAMFSGTKPDTAGPAGDRNGAGAWASSIRHGDAPPAQVLHPTLVVGDSLTAGDYVWRKFLRDNHIPHVHIGRGTEMAHTFLLNDARSVYRRRLAALGGFTRGIVQYLTNDLALNTPTQTTTLFETKIGQLVALTKAWGANEVLVGTLPPNTKTTDGWTTLAGQSLDMASNARGKNEQVLLDFNDWLRAGASFGNVAPQAWHNTTLGAYVTDWGGAEAVMDSSSGDTPSTIAKWRVNGGAHTTDGLHPGTSLGITEGFSAIPLDLFLVGG